MRTRHARFRQVPGSDLPLVLRQAHEAFCRDLRQLVEERPGQWAAYNGSAQIGFATSKTSLIQHCLSLGLKRGEFLVRSLEPARRHAPGPRDPRRQRPSRGSISRWPCCLIACLCIAGPTKRTVHPRGIARFGSRSFLRRPVYLLFQRRSHRTGSSTPGSVVRRSHGDTTLSQPGSTPIRSVISQSLALVRHGTADASTRSRGRPVDCQ